jgi:DNA-binding NarL/FixJ family response regulator
VTDLPSAPIRLLLVEDHRLFRQGLRELLEEHGHDVVAEAPSAGEGLRLASERAPDVIVLDLNLPGASGLETIPRFLEVAPAAAILVMTASAEERDVLDAIAAGAAGYVLKDASVDEMLAAVRAAAAGDSALSPVIARKVLGHVRRTAAASKPSEAEPPLELTERERDVLRLLAAGHENAQIAGELFMSIGTVKAHVAAVLAKLGVNNRVQAAAEAVRRGLV